MLQAFVSIEFALKERMGLKRGKLSKLLETAIQKGWIREDGFSIVMRQRGISKRQKEDMASLGLWASQDEEVEGFCKVLLTALPYLRNELAHGSSILTNGSASWLQTCADLINQLFPKPS